MGRIILTGDIHGNISRIIDIDDSEMTKEDIIIVLGDFGVIWGKNPELEDYYLSKLGEKKFTVAFVDGNHENFRLIKQKEKIVEWNGGRAGLLPYGIIHLLRGEIYFINGKTVGVCGGAESIDRALRVEGVSWWPEEQISDEDIENFENNLRLNYDKIKNKIDIMLTHDAPASLVPTIKLLEGIREKKLSESQGKLERILSLADIDRWYFGHWHIEKMIGDKFRCLYRDFKEV